MCSHGGRTRPRRLTCAAMADVRSHGGRTQPRRTNSAAAAAASAAAAQTRTLVTTRVVSSSRDATFIRRHQTLGGHLSDAVRRYGAPAGCTPRPSRIPRCRAATPAGSRTWPSAPAVRSTRTPSPAAARPQPRTERSRRRTSPSRSLPLRRCCRGRARSRCGCLRRSASCARTAPRVRGGHLILHEAHAIVAKPCTRVKRRRVPTGRPCRLRTPKRAHHDVAAVLGPNGATIARTIRLAHGAADRWRPLCPRRARNAVQAACAHSAAGAGGRHRVQFRFRRRPMFFVFSLSFL